MRNKNTIAYKVFDKLLFLIILIALWQGVYILGTEYFHWWKSYAVPSPYGVVQTFIALILDQTLFIAVAVSLKRMLVGYFMSIVIGTLLGLLLVKSSYLNRNLKPLILGLQTLPSICWVPFAILWYGLNEDAILFVIIIGSVFSISMSIENGIQNVDPLYIRAAKTMGAKGKNLYLKVIFPACLPAVVAGLKQGWSFAWRALMSGEMMSASKGLGQVLLMGRDLADINQVMVVIIMIVAIGTIIDFCVFQTIERRIQKKMGLDKDKKKQ